MLGTSPSLLSEPAFAHVTDLPPKAPPLQRVPVAPAVNGLYGCVWLTCLGCGEGFAVPTEAVGALVDCPACPWRGTVGDPS
jgi:hypothetical protein